MRACALLAALTFGAAHVANAADTATRNISVAYTGTSHGLVVLRLDADAALTPDRYRVHLHYRVAGIFGLFTRTEDDSHATGRFTADGATPEHFDSIGDLRGEHRVTTIEYADGDPTRLVVTPPATRERTPVSPDMERHTLDNLSAIALLVHRMAASGNCAGTATLFDGRRVTALTATDAGQVTLTRTGGIHYAGPATRCDFVGHQLAGFKLNESAAHRAMPRQGSAWFAPVVQGGPSLPVRVEFENDILGHVTLTLDHATATS